MNPSIVDVFNVAVYSQPFLFLALYRAKILGLAPGPLNWALPIAGPLAAAAILAGRVSIGHYPADILAQYCLMVAFVAWLFRRRPLNQAVALAFLVVFVNSYVWEFPIHVLDFYYNRNVGLQAVQALHLAPLAVYTLVTRIEWWSNVRRWLNPLTLAWIFVLVATWTRLNYEWPLDMLSLHVSRYLGLVASSLILGPPGTEVLYGLKDVDESRR